MKFLAYYYDVDDTQSVMIINAQSAQEAKEKFLAFETKYECNFIGLSLDNMDDMPVLNDEFDLVTNKD